jgi:segregation and condensation protein A
MKAASQAIDALPHAGRDFEVVRVWFDRIATQRFANVEAEDLRTAWAGLVQRARINRHHLVSREQLSVRAEMSRILKRLAGGRYAEFTALFAEHADVPHLVVTFLALLELAREQLVDLAQAEAYAPIHVHAKGVAPFSLAADAT